MSIPDNFFESANEEKGRELAFNIVVGLRDALNIASKKQLPPTYEQTLNILHDIDPNLHKYCTSVLQRKNENDIVKLFKAKAEAQSIRDNINVNPVDLLKEEIQEYKILLDSPGLPKEKSRAIKAHIASLSSAIENLEPRRLSEHKILERDFSLAERPYLGAKSVIRNENFVDYSLPENRVLRLRLFHPDKFEHITGADLVYEQYHLAEEKVRIAFLQYKAWENGVLYFNNQSNLEAQLNKLKNTLCSKNMCTTPSSLNGQLNYRFPYCCAFLRPTDKLQSNDSKMVSSGIHIPVCSALELKESHNKIEKSQIRHSVINQELFERLFNHSLVGSRWIAIDELEEFYKELKILTEYQTLKIYAEEIIK